MNKIRRTNKRAVRLSASALGILVWQRDFWIALIEHAQNAKPGPPNFSHLDGFKNPAVIRYAVTTLDLWHSFDRYNAGKPYHRQVRPFGFMVMFQQNELAEGTNRAPSKRSSRKRAPAQMRIIAPFNRNPAVAARHAFDRDTGKQISPTQLKTYLRALRHYHDHPEAKFLNGERADKGRTEQRHIIVRSIRHIGKEANKLDDQMAMGVDPGAQVEFGAGADGRKARFAAIKRTVVAFGPVAVARAAGISRQHLFAITKGEIAPTEGMLGRIEQALAALRAAQDRGEINATTVRAQIKDLVERIGLRQLAKFLEIDPGYLSRVLSERRPLGATLCRKLDILIGTRR